ncbi:hypothetical protein V5P93_002304 [Actinokineospora auranticolor]|uniref:Uncharacterized protein n=1 Tax=Actinokineospora auranticolor TaxID=155976 RepID=A0A2S6GDN4_9PSEU|nr:hypothetical protein [Actinokineospora auranticolor]PPK63333.1 hypothetical protein CLV40_12946 [Actinokineospora auranticolor]
MSKQQRKRTAKRRKRERAARGADGVADLSSTVSGLLGGAMRLEPYLTLAGDPAVVIALARQRVSEAVDEVLAVLAHVDAFDVLGTVKTQLTLVDPETYCESDHGATVATTELLAVILAARGTRTGDSPTGHVEPNPGVVLRALQSHLQELMDAGQVLTMFGVDRDDPMHRVSFGTRLREAAVRNTSYPHMVEDTLTALFDDPSMEEACRSVLGCTVSQIRQVLTSFQQTAISDQTGDFDLLAEFVSNTHDDVSDLADVDGIRALLEHVLDTGRGRTAERTATAAGVDGETVSAVLDLFSTPMRARSAADAVLEFLAGSSPFRTRPILAADDGEYMVVHHALLIPAVRERVEDALRVDGGAWDIYSKHRGVYLETEAARLVARHLPGQVQHLGFEYFVPANDSETIPSSYTKLAEGDGLLLVDDIAIIIEAKAVALRARSRTGDPLRLRQDLRRIVTDAAEQADRLRQRIIQDRGLRLRDGTWLDLEPVREIHSIAVSLEDLSSIATITSELVRSGLLTTDALPWTVSLHDLRVISELVDRPAELLLYLRRRTEPDTTRRFHASDELDFFLHFYAAQLYVEPDPDSTHQALPQLGAPRTKNRRRYREQHLELIISRTDPLDAWYFHQLGLRTTPADKPRMKANPALLQLIDDLTARREPGWLAMTATLLSFDDAGQRRCAVNGPRLAKQTRSDGLPHSIAMPVGTHQRDSALIIWITTPTTAPLGPSRQRLRDYTAAKKHQMQLDRGFGLLYDDRGELIDTWYDNRTPAHDTSLDILCARLSLRSPGAFVSAPPPPKKTHKPRRKR